MRILITLLYCVLIDNYAAGQDSIVNIKFEIDSKPIVYKDALVKFINNNDTISRSIEEGILHIPASVFRKRVTVFFYIDRYFLRFDSIPITINSLSPNWTLGIDKKPFNPATSSTGRSWKKIKIVYYLKNDDGRILIVDRAKKSVVIRKNKYKV